jgi:predicted DCC family thiol-disulfide oxidoreductase YuxK
MTAKTKIFFDGNCIVCDMEISHYKRKAPDLFELVDISGENFKASDYGLDPKAVEKDMHVFTPEGELRIGVDAFAHIWTRIQKYSWAAAIIQKPVIHSAAKVGYWGFTKIRPYLPKKKRP